MGKTATPTQRDTSFARAIPIVRITIAAAALVAMLAGCTPTGTATPSSSSSPSDSSSAPSGSTTPSDTPSPGTSGSPTAQGCAATPGKGIPAGAVTASTLDVDGDGRPDTQWLALSSAGSVTFGVTTASGATFSYASSSASPIARGGFVAELADHQLISLLSDGRGAYVHAIVDCRFVQPLNKQGQPYTFDMEAIRGNGTGVGCADGQLVGYLARDLPGGWNVQQTIVNISADGTRATNGATKSVANLKPASAPIVVQAQSISCGSTTPSHGGVMLPNS